MKTFFFLLLAGTAAAQSTGGPWAIKSSTLDGGGGVSTGGVWKVTGTIAQADATAGKSTGGTWSEQGGFWPGVVAEPGGPVLTVTPLGATRFTVAWTGDAIGYKLQFSANLQTWTDFPGVTITGAASALWNLSNGPRYYFRLKRLN
jgi:hypothetical protein